MKRPTHPSDVLKMLAQADILLLLRDVFAQAVSSETLMQPLESPDLLTELFHCAGLEEAGPLAARFYPLWQETVAEQGLTLRLAHHDLFEGPVPCPINQTAYVRRDKGAILADIAGFYRAFGFAGNRLSEKHDHLAVELEFSAVLLFMLAQAMADGRSEETRITDKAWRSFANDHAGAWIIPFCARLKLTSLLPLHQICAELLEALWSALVRTHGLDALATQAEPRLEDETGPYECGLTATATSLTIHRQPLSP